MASSRRGLQISHKLLALSLGGIIGTAAVLVGVGAWQSGSFADRTEREVVQQNADNLARTTGNLSSLVAQVGDEVQHGVDISQKAATVLLDQRGGMRLSDRTVRWTVTNQVTQAKRTVSLPRLTVGGDWLGRNTDFRTETPYVDDAARVSSATVTVFQRMNAAGDLLRVGTTVKANTGNRAIGTYIPAVGEDGKANAVAAAIKAGKSFRGVALVVGTWFISVYDPVKDASGRVIGALYTGVPQEAALTNLTDAVADRKVGTNGWVTILSAAPADAGRVIASSLDDAAATVDLDATDANGTRYVEEIVAKAPTLDDGTWRATYQLPGSAGAPAGPTTTTVAYYAPYQWAIVVGGYAADVRGAVDAVRDAGVTC